MKNSTWALTVPLRLCMMGPMSDWAVHLVTDSFAELKRHGSAWVDHTITDPPYSPHVHANQSSGTAMKRQVAGGGGGGIPRVTPAFDPLAGHAFAADMVAVTRRWVLSFCALEDFGAFRDAVPTGAYVRSACWYKPNSMGQLTGDRPATAYEGIAIMHRPGKKRWNGHGSYGIWKCNGTRGEKGRHPNQKPLNLCLKLVALFTDRGDTIFDPFCGSGRIGEAALVLGRKFIGWDNDPAWVERASARLAGVTAQMTDEEALKLCGMKG
jgi:hypothetical protein